MEEFETVSDHERGKDTSISNWNRYWFDGTYKNDYINPLNTELKVKISKQQGIKVKNSMCYNITSSIFSYKYKHYKHDYYVFVDTLNVRLKENKLIREVGFSKPFPEDSAIVECEHNNKGDENLTNIIIIVCTIVGVSIIAFIAIFVIFNRMRKNEMRQFENTATATTTNSNSNSNSKQIEMELR